MNLVALVPILCAFCIKYVGEMDGDEYCLSHIFQIDKLMSFGKSWKTIIISCAHFDIYKLLEL
jgi:hypothetical protein